MLRTKSPASLTVTVFTRHAPDCPKKADRYWKRCGCRKALYVYADGKPTVVSAKTRSWEQAERLAQAERDARDPAKVKLLEIERVKAEETAAEKAKNITVGDACERWLASQKFRSGETATIHRRVASRINACAGFEGIVSVKGITPDKLDEWRGRWGSQAEREFDRIGQTSQSAFQGYLKAFCRWCEEMGFVEKAPATFLRGIPKLTEEVRPLSEQTIAERAVALLHHIVHFNELIAGCHADKDQRVVGSHSEPCGQDTCKTAEFSQVKSPLRETVRDPDAHHGWMILID